ncbi:hypothetical protein Ahy_B08g093398 [Arachis hypogaea]|uniref:Uncharacterized protein n=1 Tax=Arachis hypogaea TaxID=3818 RepID=A0A444Y628_ARAHY|nr:hypothetical protein Ahy_B08g093398 [Arachis hypogaea]
MAPRVKGKGVKGHKSSCTTAAAAITTTSTSFGTSVVPNFQSGPLTQQSLHRSSSTKFAYSRMYGSPSPPPPPILIPLLSRNFSLLVDLEIIGSSSTSLPLETASVPNGVTKERLVPDGKISWLSFSPGSQKITEIIKKRYDKLYKKFGDVPLPTKKLWFKEATFLLMMMMKGFFWRAFKYKTNKKKARENRASLLGGSFNCGGSIPLSSTIERMKKQLGRTPTYEEVFKKIHTLKSDMSKWVDKHFQDTHEKFIKKYTLDFFGKDSKEVEKLERTIGNAKKKKPKQKRWNEAYVSYYKKVRASNSFTSVLLPPPPSISLDEDYNDNGDEDDSEDYS